MSLRIYPPYLSCIAAATILASTMTTAAEEGRRWRVFENGDRAVLAAAHTGEPTDDLGSPFFRCEPKSGTIVIEGTATQELRNAVADLIRSNGYPQVDLIPPSSFGPALLDLSYSEMGSDWQYSFKFEAIETAFNEFTRAGRLTFKVGNTVIREEFKMGLENVARFQTICARSK